MIVSTLEKEIVCISSQDFGLYKEADTHIIAATCGSWKRALLPWYLSHHLSSAEDLAF